VQRERHRRVADPRVRQVEAAVEDADADLGAARGERQLPGAHAGHVAAADGDGHGVDGARGEDRPVRRERGIEPPGRDAGDLVAQAADLPARAGDHVRAVAHGRAAERAGRVLGRVAVEGQPRDRRAEADGLVVLRGGLPCRRRRGCSRACQLVADAAALTAAGIRPPTR
jgi:hypothetical protein